MIYQILYFAAMVVLVLSLLLITLLRKKQPRLSTKYWDFISIAAMFFGGFAFLSLLYHDVNLGQTPGDTITKIMLIVFPSVMIVFMIMYLVLFFWKGGITNGLIIVWTNKLLSTQPYIVIEIGCSEAKECIHLIMRPLVTRA
jgi:hypothetical protein